MTSSKDPYATKPLDTQSPDPDVRTVTAADALSIPGYETLEELGRGGMGVVYRVRQHTTGTILALKMILCGRDASQQDLARFRIEVEAMACLNHPNIVKIRDVGMFRAYPYFALEFAERGTLKRLIQGQAQPPLNAAEAVKTLAFAMQHAHSRGMLHRDLKPANILVMGDGTLKISDFGLVKFAVPFERMTSASRFDLGLDQEFTRFAREFQAQYRTLGNASFTEGEELRLSWQDCAKRTGLLDQDSPTASIGEFLTTSLQQGGKRHPILDDLTRTGSVMGSAQYMAPEQASGQLEDIGRHTDVYGLGGILYEMLTGQPPFRSANLYELLDNVCFEAPSPPRRFAPTIPPELEVICLKCLEKEGERRYPTAFALGEDLHKFLGGFGMELGV